MAQTSTYSYTERKRIRKSFGSRDSVLKVPYLLQMQRDAYTAFLQAETPPQKRSGEGLQAAFNSFRTPLIFSATIMVVALTALLLTIISLAERLLLGPDDTIAFNDDGE